MQRCKKRLSEDHGVHSDPGPKAFRNTTFPLENVASGPASGWQNGETAEL
jgi:hypothetical protein